MPRFPVPDPHDTIAALATPAGTASIAVIRMSGKGTFGILDKLFRGRSGGSISKATSHTVHFGTLEDQGRSVDEVLVTVFKSQMILVAM